MSGRAAHIGLAPADHTLRRRLGVCLGGSGASPVFQLRKPAGIAATEPGFGTDLQLSQRLCDIFDRDYADDGPIQSLEMKLVGQLVFLVLVYGALHIATHETRLARAICAHDTNFLLDHRPGSVTTWNDTTRSSIC